MKNKLTLLNSRLSIIICLFLVFALQNIVAKPTSDFIVGIDICQYRNKSENNYLELYYSYQEASLSYIKKGDGFEGAIAMSVTFTSNESDSVFLNKNFRIPHLVSDTTNLDQKKSLVGMINMLVPNRDQNMSIESIDDHNNSRNQTITFQLQSKSFFSESVSISDVELASTIRKMQSGKKTIFTKSSYDVIPNPSGIYSNKLPRVYYYFEVYNMLQGIPGDNYSINTTILDLNGLQVLSKQKTKKRLNESSVEVGQIDVGSLPSGVYIFDAQILDPNGEALSNTRKPFTYINQKTIVTRPVSDLSSSDLLKSQLYAKSENALDAEFASLRYIAKRSEIRAYKKTKTLDNKVNFLTDFWDKRDSDPGTLENETRDEYLSRVEYASRFASGLKKGWQSDRGRIIILYGEPDEYSREATSIGTAPHEIWYYYNLQGGVIFVFAALGGGQEHRLIHSTHRSELQDFQWMETLKK